jgi:Lrp/AsnC family leucine-responsive transcriptional regulator
MVMGFEVDEKDERIIGILERRSGLSSRALSGMLDIPISTVHRRIKRLENDGVIRGYKALIDYEKTGRPIGALLLIDLAEVIPGKGHIPKKNIIDTLKKSDEVEEIVEVQAATFDLVVRVRLPSLRRLAEFVEELRYIEGIEETTSAIITEETTVPPRGY